jgi:O-acetyl-ADP-ribose deacetylase (regulator of RNase III)
VTSTVTIGGARLVLRLGDLTEEDAGAIVNAANSGLLGGGGVDGAIHRRGGPAIAEECRRIREERGGCPPGDAVITGGGNLGARHVIHAVGPIWRGGGKGEEAVLRSAYRRSLEVARAHGIRTVAFPSISTGAYRYPIAAAAAAAIDEVWEALLGGGIDEVRFVLFSPGDLEVYGAALAERAARPSASPRGRDEPRGLDLDALAAAAPGLHARLVEDRVILDLRRPDVLAVLRRDVERIADSMESEDAPPPMLWSGIPFPEHAGDLTSDECLIVSVGGTKTEYALMRLERGEPILIAEDGSEVRGDACAEAKKALCFPTPTDREMRTGHEMIERIADRIGRYLEPQRGRLERCRAILLSWGFAHDVYRSSPRLLGGLSARSTLLSKGQGAFTRDLAGKDLGEVLGAALERRLGWSRPVTVANDGVMALHYFLTPEHLAGHAQVGLFINGTGANFAIAEDYAVRAEGVVSRPGEEYEPDRITRTRPLRPGERRERYFVNYEAGSITLDATRTPFDRPSEFPIEENALAGGNAFGEQFREIVRARVSPEVHERLLAAWRRRRPGTEPQGPDVSRIATGGPGEIEPLFPGAGLDERAAAGVRLVCGAIVVRSALHAGLVLSAITSRLGFGLGGAQPGRGKDIPDLLALEGSVWKTPGYQDLVRSAWGAIVGDRPLRVDFAHEKSYDASLPGPLYLAVLAAAASPAGH